MNKEQLAVYFIMGSINCEKEPLHVLEQALKNGVTIFQLREKGEGALIGDARVAFAKECQLLCATYHVPFIINDDVELAKEIEADGLHVGQDDMALSLLRADFPNKIIGVSVHNEEELHKAVQDGADYVGIGPIHATTSKKDAKKPAGVTFLARARQLYKELPIVAIGGMTADRTPAAIAAGADGVAVISAICQSDNIPATVRGLREVVR